MVSQPSRRTSAGVVAAAFAFIAFMTLRPAQFAPTVPVACIFCGSFGGVDFLLNIVLFVPLGIGTRWLSNRALPAVIIGLITTLFIEAMQWQVVPGRDASVGDVLANTIGAGLGAWLAMAVLRWLDASPPEARRLAPAFGIITAILVLVSGALLLPAQPRWKQFILWKPIRANLDQFRGRLDSVLLGGGPIHVDSVLDQDSVFDPASRSISVRAFLRPPIPASRRTAIIVQVANSREEGFMLGQRGENAVYRSYQLAARLKFRPVLLGMKGRCPHSKLRLMVVGPSLLPATSSPRAITLERQPGVWIHRRHDASNDRAGVDTPSSVGCRRGSIVVAG